MAERLDLPPPPDARAALPAAFGRRFAIFADAEEEFDWSRPFDRAATATGAIASLPEANRRLCARGVIPTYLIDYPVACNRASGDTIAAMVAADACDVGAQLHPWVTPPFDEIVNDRNSFPGNLPEALEAAKIAAITAAVRERIGVEPVAYRAGRYGVGRHTAALLADAGYRLDVSVRALYDYAPKGGPDFARHPVTPWWLARDLLEVPLTAAWVSPIPGLRAPASPWLRRMLARAHLLGRVALTPEDMPVAAALRAVDVLLDSGHRLFSLSFHTPSVEPGHTPYVRDAADLARFWAWWDAILDRFARAGVLPVRPRDIVAAADAARLASTPRQPLTNGAGPVAQG